MLSSFNEKSGYGVHDDPVHESDSFDEDEVDDIFDSENFGVYLTYQEIDDIAKSEDAINEEFNVS